jgi:hypothetical protein
MDEQSQPTSAEVHLLDIISQVTDIESAEARATLAYAVNQVFAECLRKGYVLDFAEGDGIVLHTPSGLKLWFAPLDENDRVGVVADTEDMASAFDDEKEKG